MEKLQNEKLHESYPSSYMGNTIKQKQPGVSIQRPGGCRLHTATVVLTPCSLGRTGRGTGGCVLTVAVVCPACELCSTWLFAAVRQFQCRLLTKQVSGQSDRTRS